MKSKLLVAAISAGGLVAGITGCSSDRPHQYGQDRPPVTDLYSEDRGLQSKDVVSASDQMAHDLLADPRLNASATQWTIVVDHITDESRDHRVNMDIFLERLKMNLARYGNGRVQLIENRAKLQGLQSRELDPVRGPDYGQGGAPQGTNGIQPDYALHGRIMEMPNRATSYYLIEFTATNLHTRQIAWTNGYEVKVRTAD